MAQHARAERGRKHVTQTAHYEQQRKAGWKESLHLFQVNSIITYSPINLRTAVTSGLFTNQACTFGV